MRRVLSLSFFFVLAALIASHASAASCPPGYRNYGGICYWHGAAEPTTNVSNLPPLTQPADRPVRGIADVHMHQFANLGFGGALVWGSSFDRRGINGALPWCDYTEDFRILQSSGAEVPYIYGWEAHGPKAFQWGSHAVSLGIKEGLHDVGGAGAFDGWPTYTTMTHQQMYYKWLERAYQGGVRLAVMLAVSNEAMCRASKRRADYGSTACADMPSVDRQLQAAKDLEAYVDEIDGPPAGSGWYRIAYSPSQARQIIRSGKMAVVLGIEVDSLFGCKPGAGCTASYVHSEIERYYAAGVRHVYPIHQYDNAFGGAAIFRDLLNTGNAVVTGSHFAVRDCSGQGYNYNVSSDGLVEFIGWLTMGAPFPNQAYYNQFAADCNEKGLTTLGQSLILNLMDHRLIIDVDHMSRLMMDEVIGMAETHNPPHPLVSGHSDFYNTASPRSEFTLTPDQLVRIRNLGGIITATTVPHRENCYSSSDYAWYYNVAKSAMTGGPYGTGYEGVAFSTDFNGWGMQPGPRFGRTAEGCADDDRALLSYPFTGLFGGQFERQVTGDRTFNFNYTGLAHAGLVPDLIADLKAQGRLTDADLEPLYNSAETYIRMWELIEPPAKITPQVTGTQGDHGWYTSEVNVTWKVEAGSPNNPVVSKSGCDATTISSDTGGTTLTCSASTATETRSVSVVIHRDATPPVATMSSSVPPGTWTNGDITVRFSATDAMSGIDGSRNMETVLTGEGADLVATAPYSFRDKAGNEAVASQGGFDIDRTPPAMAAAVSPDANPAGWHRTDPTVTFTATDALSGVAGDATIAVPVTTEGADIAVTRTFTDVAGNQASLTKSVKLDKTIPAIALASRLPAANEYGWNNGAVTATWSCSDALSGVLAHSVSATRGAEGASQSASGTCTDVAGNFVTDTIGGINIDLTTPVVSYAITPAANAAGWHNTDVTLTFTASDALSGVRDASTINVLFTDDGANLGAERTFLDKAGNSASLAVAGINLDKTPPSISCIALPGVLWPANHKLVPVKVTLTFTDALSQTAGYTLVTAASSEADLGLGEGDTPVDIVGFTVGGTSLSGSLRAERAGFGAGRVYTLGYRGLDLAGNSATCSTTVIVPRDQSSK